MSTHGLPNRRAPNLDILVTSHDQVVGIESKCLEPLTPHRASFAPAYSSHLIDRRPATWLSEMQSLIEEPNRYRWLDAAQLVKHAFGLSYTFPGASLVLIYLYWEPTNPQCHPAFMQHRAEIDRFCQCVSGTGPTFLAMSYRQIWRFWEDCSQPLWLKTHVRCLRARYEVALN